MLCTHPLRGLGSSRAIALSSLLITATLLGCDGSSEYAQTYVIESMAQVIGGPAAAARPGDYLLENDQIRAVIHGRHNQRGSLPITNGSMVDLDLQRPLASAGGGRGQDAFYELGPMVNFKVNSSSRMRNGMCETVNGSPSLGAAPCPCAMGSSSAIAAACQPRRGCARVTATGRSEPIMGAFGLLDLALQRQYDASVIEITTDYDLCPGERVVRVANTIRFGAPGEPVDMEELPQRSPLMEVLMGQSTGKSCNVDGDCEPGETCEKMLLEIKLGAIDTKMRRCRRPADKVAGVMAGDFILYTAKAAEFVPGDGFDFDSYIRTIFDTGGDVFSHPLAPTYLGAASDKVSYAYFNETGRVMIPIFAEAFTAAMSNRYACPQSNQTCLKGKELRFRRYVSVGHGDLASALEEYYRIRGISTGQLSGHVIDARTQRPLSGMSVFALSLPKAWDGLSDGELAQRSYDELVAANRAETKTDVNPGGEVGVVSHFRTDSAPMDSMPDGSFSGPLPPGRYALLARSEERPASRLVAVRISAGRTAGTTLSVGDAGVLAFVVRDRTGKPLPSKLTIGHCFPECARNEDCSADRPVCDVDTELCVPQGGYSGPASCRPDQRWAWDARLQRETCSCPAVGLLPLALGGRRSSDGTVRTVLSDTGEGEVRLEPSEVAYQVVVSRGMEYENERQFVSIRPAMVSRLSATLPRVVDTTGWISADFHVHGLHSPDSPLTHDARVRSCAAEGLELMTATDHDQITDYQPTVRRLGLQGWLKSQSGVEVSPLEYGHYVGFPLRFDENKELNGAFHWRATKAGATASEDDFRFIPPVDVIKGLRELGAVSPDSTLAFVAHFWDYFTFYGVDPWTLESPLFGLGSISEVTLPRNFTGEFDALEAFNGKNMDYIRRPSYREVREFNIALAGAVAAGRELSYEERQRTFGRVSAAAQRNFLRRTKDEQSSWLTFSNKDFSCRCSSDADCGAGAICQETTGGCIAACSSEVDCDATLVAAGRERCLPLGSDPQRRICQRVSRSCVRDEDCSGTWSGKTQESCVALDGATERTCQFVCTSNKDCTGDPLRTSCETRTGTCGPPLIVAAQEADPCPTIRGTLDDWFQVLNHGVRRPILGNSDSHTVYSVEAGLPRNYVRSQTDLPDAIRSEEVVAQVKQMQTFPTYGPFVELTLNNQPLGSVVPLSKGATVSLHLKVQSPTWFDVDRIEVYRNGELIREINGRVGCLEGSLDCIPIPNRRVMNFDGVLTDQPTVDAWYVVVVMGLDGKTLAPVYSSSPVARLGMFELIQRLTPLLPPLRSFRTPLSPSMTRVRPYAVTNPIWVDVGGDGLTAPKPFPSWAPNRDRPAGSQTSALRPAASTGAAGGPSRPGSGTLRAAGGLERPLGKNALTPEAIQHALDSLRYLSFPP